MAIYIKKNNQLGQPTALMSNKTIKSIYVKQGNEDAVCVWGVGLNILPFTYTKSTTAVTITGLKEGVAWESLTIPETIEDLPVTQIASNAFKNKQAFKYMELPSSLTQIGSDAFNGCSSLKEIIIPAGVTSIGGTNDASNVFGYCSSLESIKVDNKNANFASEGNCLLSKNKGTLITGCKNSIIPQNVYRIRSSAFLGCSLLTQIKIPHNCENIEKGAFRGCSRLTEITVPFIGGNASTSNIFGYIFGATDATQVKDYVPASLKKVSIEPRTTISIPEQAFKNCSNIEEVYLTPPYQTTGYSFFIENIGKYAFHNCSKLKTINLEAASGSIGDYAFLGCGAIEGELTINNFISRIGRGAFKGCNSLSKLTVPFIGESETSNRFIHYIFGSSSSDFGISSGGEMPNSLKEIVVSKSSNDVPNSAFWSTAFEKITFKGIVKEIGQFAFSRCLKLKDVVFERAAHVETIGVGAFQGSSLTAYNIPHNVRTIGNQAFMETGLTTIIVPDEVETIGSFAFKGCTGLTSVTIGKRVTSIGSSAFSGCSRLTKITGSSTISAVVARQCGSNSFEVVITSGTSIGDSAFRDCGLTSITIPDSVTSIGQYAFYECIGLTSIIVDEGNTKYHSTGNCLIETATKTLVLGCKTSVIPTDGSVTSIGRESFHDCTGLTSITIPDNVTSIGRKSFEYCTGLTSVTIGGSVTYIDENAFAYCTKLTSITFNGTITQWNAIPKYNQWNYGTGNYTIHCTDGDIPK